MIVPIIMAIWFDYRARKAGRSVIGWALGGAVLAFVVSTIFTNAAILMVAGSLTGRVEFDTYITIRIVTAILAIVAMIFIGKSILPSKASETLPPTDRFYAKPPGGAEFLYSLSQLRGAYDQGKITTAWTVRKDGEADAKPVAEVLGAQPTAQTKS